MKYCKIVNGVIEKYNVDKPSVVKGGDTSIYLPIVEVKPPMDPSIHRYKITYVIEGEKVNKVYELVDIPTAELIIKKNNTVVKTIDNLIHIAIVDYNTANGTDFTGVNSLPKFVIVPTYSHNAFCTSMVEWVAKVWDYVRQVQIDILAGARTEPTLEALLEELPTRV